MEIQLNDKEKKKKHARKQNIIALAIIVVGTILSFVFFGLKNKNNEDNLTENITAVKMVKTLKISRADSSWAVLEKTVKFSALGSGDAVAEYSGRIEKVNFNIGDYIKEGQVLAVFSQADIDNSAKVSLASAQESLNLANDNLSQTKEIAEESIKLAKNAVNIAELQLKQAEDDSDKDAIELAEENLKIAKNQKDQAENSAELQKNSARLQAKQAELAFNQAQINYDKTFIKAPLSGFIVSKNIENDDYIYAGTAVAQIAGESKLKGTIFLNQDEASRIIKGDKVEIIAGGGKYEGTAVSVSGIANGENQRFEVVIETDQKLVKEANQSAIVKLNLRLENEENFFVPLEAVNIGQNKKQVFIIKDGQALAVEVEIGKIIGKQVEITKGLRENDEIIIEGNRNLQEGEKVKSF